MDCSFNLWTDHSASKIIKEEILAGGKLGIGAKELKTSPWVKIERVSEPDKVELLYELKQGEAEVIVLAREKGDV